jgi:hypothetical protein
VLGVWCAQLFVIPTGGSTVYVEPERRDLSSIPPQATRCLKCLVRRVSQP